MTKLRVALVITDLDIGGAEHCLVDLATRLDRDRFEPIVYCLAPRPEREEASCVPPLEEAGIPVHCLGAVGLRHAPFAVRRLGRLLADQRPDIVQSFLFHANIVGRIAARRAGAPRIVSGIRVAERYSRWHLWADRLTSRLVDRYVGVSQSVCLFSTQEAGLPAGKMVAIPNGIDIAGYPAEPADTTVFGIQPGCRVVTFVGRLEEQKGVRWLLETASDWLASQPDVHLLLVGSGPQRTGLEELCRRKQIDQRVHFTGWRSDVPKILARTALLVLPSRWEGMPNVVLQAMASRLAVLATDVEGIRELLGELALGQTVAYGDSAAWTAKLIRLLSDEELRRDFGRRNRWRAETYFPISRMVEAYQDLWLELRGVDQ